MIRVLETSFENAGESLQFEQDQAEQETLHLWESPRYSVVLGHSGQAEREVDLTACDRDGVPVIRRSSGGGTVLVGPGCLNYALLLSLEARPQLHDVRQSFCLLLRPLAATLMSRCADCRTWRSATGKSQETPSGGRATSFCTMERS
jgi:lipoate-protein ligase A